MTTFATNVDEFDQSPAWAEESGPSSPSPPADVSRGVGGKRSRAKRIDKSALAFPEPRRIRDRDHVRYVAKQPCLICGRRPSDPHHLRFAQTQALGRKVSDEFVVPLCRGHHREVHRCGDETVWWSNVGVNPMVAARTLWVETHRKLAAHDQAVIESPTRNGETKPFAGAGAP
jgi:hypothetical protein